MSQAARQWCELEGYRSEPPRIRHASGFAVAADSGWSAVISPSCCYIDAMTVKNLEKVFSNSDLPGNTSPAEVV